MHAIQLVRPAPYLRRYVRFYAQRNGHIRDGFVVHPVIARAAPLLEFNFGDPFEVLHQEKPLARTSPRGVVVGMQTHYRLQLRLAGTLDSFVIIFQPCGMHQLFSIPMHN